MAGNHGVYAYVCALCDHLASRHGLVAGASITDGGPFECRNCGCRMTQETPCHALNRRQYEQFARSGAWLS